MCDDFTAAADEDNLAAKGLSRREFAAVGAAAALAGYATVVEAATRTSPLRERLVEVRTLDGTADALFVHPARGRHPGVILWPDVLGLREAKMAMGRRLAAAGYAVLVVNPYYRGHKGSLNMTFADFRTPEGTAKLGPLRSALTSEAAARDGAAFAAWLDTQAAVDKRRGIGNQGYCMTGSFAIRTAAASPRVRAAASFHGGGLVTDKPDSPHRLLANSQASYLIAIAKNDDEKAPAEKDVLRAAAAAAGHPAEIEVYPADHGWCVPDAPSYNREQAERAWTRLLALYSRL